MITKRKIPLRKCVATNKILPKKELVRIVLTKDKKIFVDHSNKANGKGIYIQPKTEFVAIIKKNKSLEKTFHTKISDQIYEDLITEIKNFWD